MASTVLGMCLTNIDLAEILWVHKINRATLQTCRIESKNVDRISVRFLCFLLALFEFPSPIIERRNILHLGDSVLLLRDIPYSRKRFLPNNTIIRLASHDVRVSIHPQSLVFDALKHFDRKILCLIKKNPHMT